MNKLKLFFLFCVLFFVSCNPSADNGKEPENPPAEEYEIEEGSNFITAFSSKTEGKTISFSWDYLYDDFGHLDVTFTKYDGGTKQSFSITDASQKTYVFEGDADSIYSFSFIPYTSKEVKCREVKDTRLIHEPILKSGLPRLIIETSDGVWPTCDYVNHPVGTVGKSIKNNENVACSVRLEDADGKALNKKDNYSKSECKIRIRGNTSAWSAKKPYKIKLNKKEDLVGIITKERDGKRYEDKNWVLLNLDHLLNDMIGYETTGYMGLEFSPAYAYVDVYVNGDYRGMYLLVENVKEGNTDETGLQSRCAIDPDGYILEYDSYWWNEDLYIRTEAMHRTITFKYPDPEDITESQLDFIIDYIHEAELALLKKDDSSYLDYFDSDSFVKWAMVHEFLGCADPGGSNQFVIKRNCETSSKLEMTTAWDFGGIMEDSEKDKVSSMNRFDYFLTQRLLQKKPFMQLFVNEYNAKKKDLVSYLDSKIEALDSKAINQAVKYDNWRWDGKTTTVENAKKQMDDWLTSRIKWMDTVYK